MRAALARRGDAALDRIVGHLLALDIRRRELLTTVETLKAERNAMSDEVARRKKAKAKVKTKAKAKGPARRSAAPKKPQPTRARSKK